MQNGNANSDHQIYKIDSSITEYSSQGVCVKISSNVWSLSYLILFIYIDVNYKDPVGPLPVRPMTAAGKRDDDFGDEILGNDLLPE